MNLYRSIAMGDSVPGKRSAGSMHTTATGIVFESETFKETLSLDKIKIWKGGASDKLIFFSHPDVETVFYTENKTILSETVFESNRDISEQIRKIRKKNRIQVLWTGGIL